MTAELTPGGVDSVCHPSEGSEMSTSVLVDGNSISGKAMLQRNEGYAAAKLPNTRRSQKKLNLVIEIINRTRARIALQYMSPTDVISSQSKKGRTL